MLTIGNYVVYLALRLVEVLLKLLPLNACCVIGETAGWLFYCISPSYRRLVSANMHIAFGGELTEPQIHALVRRHFITLGRNIVASIKIAMMPTSEIEARITYEGLEHLATATAGGRGMIAAVGHFGNWELLAHLPKLFPTEDRATLFQSLGNPFINRHIMQSRSRSGITLFDRNEGIFGPLKYIREGAGVAVLFDQHAGDLGTWVPLFGRLASTTRLPALMAIKSKVALVAISVHAEKRGYWRIVVKPPIEPTEAVPGGANRAAWLTLRLNRAIEELIRLAPEEWFWVHDRWKTPNPDFLLASRRRDTLIAEDASPHPFRVLVRSPNPLGDACMAIPAVRAMKRGTRPDLELTVLCRANLAPLWQRVAEVDRVIVVDRRDSARKVGKIIRSTVRFDAAVLLPNSLRSALECRFAGIPRLVGMAGHQRRYLLHQIVPAREVAGSLHHHAESYLRIAAHCGADIEIDDDTRDFANDMATILPPRGERTTTSPIIIGLCPGAEYGNAKRWPLARYAEAVLAVHERFSDQRELEFRIFGSPNETELATRLAEQIAAVHPVNRAGQTDIAGLCDELTACTAVLTNDTGTMHLAAALGVPTVAIFGSTEPAWTAPLGHGHSAIRRHVECSPCFLRDCPRDYRCMHEIDTSKVIDALSGKISAPATS